MKWPGVGFTVELACGQQVYMGTLEEMAQREAAGISGPDPCAEDRVNGRVKTAHGYRYDSALRRHSEQGVRS